MSFFRERYIKKPRKQYRCDLCFGPITGEHTYISAYGEDFWTARAHLECEEAVRLEQEAAVKAELVEVPSGMVEYVKSGCRLNLKGYKLSLVSPGDLFLARTNGLCQTAPSKCLHNDLNPASLRFVKQKQVYQEYPIVEVDGKYYFQTANRQIELSPNLVGFAGVKFKGQHSPSWSFHICRGINSRGSLMSSCTGDTKPAVPYVVRFLETQ